MRRTIILGVTIAVVTLFLVHSARAGLVGHWKLDEATGTRALDSSGRNFHGTYEGGATLGQAGADGFAVGLDGVNDRVQLPALKLNRNTVTITAWVWRRGNPSIYAGIFVSRAGKTTAGISTGSTLDAGGWGVNNLLAYNWNDAAAAWSFNSGLLIPEQEWAFVAAVIEPDRATLYMDDGELQSAVNPVAHGIEEFDGVAYIGYDPFQADRYWPGMIDDVRVYDRAMSEDQIQGLLAGTEPTWFKATKPDPADGAPAVQHPMFKWSAGDDAGSHDVYFGASPDLGADQRVSARWPGTAYYHMVDLTPGVTYYWRIDEVGKDGVTVYTGDVWSFTTQALTAYLPQPADAAVDASTTPDLTWQAGLGAVQHHVYFGSSSDAVRRGAPETDKGVRELADANFAPGVLNPVTTYFWRVDEILDDTAVKTGPVWSLTTCLPVDDFESYTDEIGRRIFQTWIDGLGYTEPAVVAGNGSGATVGHAEPPFAERKIVHGGQQSMPMDYNNVDAPNYSATNRTFTPAMDWTVNGATDIVVYLRGKTTNKPATLYLSIHDASDHSAWTEPFDQAMVTRPKWTKWRIPVALFTALGVDMTRVRKVTIGVYDKPGAAGATGTLYIDDIQVIKVAEGQ